MTDKYKFSALFLFLSFGFGVSACISLGSGDQDESSGVIGATAVQPAQISPDECVSYTQLKRDTEYLCELADGSTRPLKSGERRTTPLSKNEIAQVMQNNSEDSESCLQAARDADPKAQGKIYIKFEIESDGRVSETTYQKDKSTFRSDTLARCL